jgi:hypothetical protein|uniref:Uncharacterized protein n=1 Tax=viral metagenome TaxID=1070528 RepID=A0A6C0ID44_9ZZZZ
MSCTLILENFKKLGGKLGCDYDKQTCYLSQKHKFGHINQYCEFNDETKTEIDKLYVDMKNIPEKYVKINDYLPNDYLPHKFVIQLYEPVNRT